MSTRLTIGDIEITALSDGPFPAALDSFIDFDLAETERLTGKRAGDPMFLPVNCYLLKLAAKWALVDAGCGPTMGPDLGQLPNALAACGLAPEAIDYVLLTHIHPDHATGLIDAAGRAVFPNAELVVHENEAQFWLDRDVTAGATERIRRSLGDQHSLHVGNACVHAGAVGHEVEEEAVVVDEPGLELLPLEDREVSQALEKSFTRRGMTVMTNARFDSTKVEVTKDGKPQHKGNPIVWTPKRRPMRAVP
jgi:glyoxylase-like metal-dependent hydrolase (beta-lactamase superfamily II)